MPDTEYIVLGSELSGVADKIRAKGGTSAQLSWPTGYEDAIDAISEGIDISDTTAIAGDVLSGKYFYTSAGIKTEGTIATKTSSNLSVSGATVTAPAGYYSSAASTTVASGSAFTPATTITVNPTISVNANGLITATNSKTQSVTPTVNAGYVSNGTAGTITIDGSNTSQLTTQAAQTITPTTTDQTIASGKYLTGTQTIKGDANLVAANIADGVTIFGVSGTHSGGGSGLKDFIEQHGTMSSFEDSTVSIVGSGAFAYCTSLTTVSFPSCTSIGSSAFYSCSRLTTANFPSCTSIGSFAFQYCDSLTTVSFPSCTTIGTSAFGYCYSLTTVSFPSCTTIGSYAFASSYSLTTASFPSCTTIGVSAFCWCIGLTTVSFPSCTSIDNRAFGYCYSLTTVSFPSCTIIGSYAFYSCISLTTVSFPSCTIISGSAFCSCISLTTVSFPSCTSIGSAVFSKCYKLTSLYLLNSSVATLSNSNAFSSTPIAGYTTSTGGVYGSIYVRASLLASWKAATNWTYFSSRFVGLTDAQIAILDGTAIQFQIGVANFVAENGMDWAQFIESSYNQSNMIIENGYVLMISPEQTGGIYFVVSYNGSYVSPTENIVSGRTYEVLQLTP